MCVCVCVCHDMRSAGAVTTVMVVPRTKFQRHSTLNTCPHCGMHNMSTVHYEPGGAAWLACVILFLLGCWLIPFCIEDA